MYAGLAQLLPASLFENRHGRSACRLLGISYRQAKLGSRLNGEALDHGGWRRLKTCPHFDNAAAPRDQALYKFWHSEESSEPDNMLPQLVRVDHGVDEAGVRLYSMHPRRVGKASARRLLPVFRRSAIASRLRDEPASRE
uniref:Uncharacterized protein n=1 Tax=Coccolithus braarudii TaxID=221442 RepID=A0A7S0LLH8_9EUKA|mmetsp:Transcript_46817/g.99888  ORF Transcript_46817/g.99888 Transcript_46817/m.99888 type:complete len:140 (+) Transcript_46817:838-1257(+)